MPHSPAQVAKTLGISVQSVRDWTRQYAPILSPQARGENGPRLFDDNDLNTMRTIAGLRRSGLRADEIIQRVQHGSIPPIVDVAHESPQQQPTETPQTATEAPLALYALQSSLDKRIDALERALVALDQRQSEAANKFVSGAVVGAAVVLVVVALVLALAR